MPENALVKMVDIHKWFGKVYALKGVDFTVNKEEIVGLVGDNGAGKSTLIKILAGIYPPDKGKIYFEGKEVKFSSPRDAMKIGIEVIHQELTVAPLMSIARNIFMGREIEKRIGLIKLLDLKRMEDEAAKALNRIGLFIRDMNTIVENLSGGERQGVAIARAMYFKTKLLILDEPTNNLSVK
ncbi:MAG: ATP-binding cassette domain-containing protein [Candidatus Micrarchaeia archaeon]